MTNVKKYRAGTTREALEMIKRDLGEDAFVLETKRIKTGGFLGLRTSMQVEVSAAAPVIFEPTAKKADGGRNAFRSHKVLNLTDDTPAAPRNSAAQKKQTLISALSARAAAANEFEKESAAATAVDTAAAAARIEPVEISSEAPRIVHPRREATKPPPPAANELVDVPRAEPAPGVSNRELEMLRAEVREVKFSIGAFSGLQSSGSWLGEVDLDVFGEVFGAPFHDIYVDLIGVGILPEIARRFVSDIVPLYRANPVAPQHLTRATLVRALTANLKFEADIVGRDRPVILALVGPTGVGKTTTLAKLAARVSLHEHRKVELVTLDTYRIAAVEQLKTYAEIIGAGCHVVRSVLELDATLRKLPHDATVLIDTTGRSPHDLADQYELSEYLRQHGDIRKCLAVQATTHPIDSLAAIKKFEMYGADCLAVTKMDETMRPGAVIETIAQSGLPLAYFCTGQRVPEDLSPATAESLTDRILLRTH